MKLELLSLPFIGAFIGYFTNYVAIKMLFLPKKPYYIFGIRVPFTPGLIPKKRKELIDKISSVVAQKVVSKKEIIRYIYKKKNRAFLYDFAERTINSLLGRKLSVLTLDKKRIEEQIECFLVNNLDSLIQERLKNINIDIEYFIYNIMLQVDRNKPIKSFLPEDTLKGLKELSVRLADESLKRLSETVETDEVKALIRKKLIEALQRYADSSNILIASIVSMVSPFLEDSDKIINTIVFEVQSLLKEPQIRNSTAQNIYAAIENQILNRTVDEACIALKLGSFEDLQMRISSRIKQLFEEMKIKERLIDNAIKSIDKHSLAVQLADMLFIMGEKYTFYDILRIAKPDVIEKLPSMVVNNLLFVIKKESEQIFSFDIAKLAREKLEKLDISEIEDVVLNISKDQFTYINIFGGILGFMIGLIEIAISYLQ